MHGYQDVRNLTHGIQEAATFPSVARILTESNPLTRMPIDLQIGLTNERTNEPGLLLSEVVARVTVKDVPSELVVGGYLL